MEESDLKRRLAKAKASGRHVYPRALREAVVKHATQRRAERVSRERIARELGMSPATLDYWCAPARRGRGELTPVTIVARPEPAREVIVEVGPLRVRGLDVTTLAELLRRLA